MVLTGQYRFGWAILPTTVGYCLNTNWACGFLLTYSAKSSNVQQERLVIGDKALPATRDSSSGEVARP